MPQITDDELLKCVKESQSEFITLAEIHKILFEKNIKCTIEEMRLKIYLLHHDGYLGNEPTEDGINMYYILFYPEQTE